MRPGRPPQFEVNKFGTGMGYCQVCVYLIDANPFFGAPQSNPPPVGGDPIIFRVCKMMTPNQNSLNLQMPKSANAHHHADAYASIACQLNLSFWQFRTRQK